VWFLLNKKKARISLFGIPFHINFLFWLLIFLSVVAGNFQEIIILFAIILIHELGHIFVAKSYKWSIEEIELLPFGGVAKISGYGKYPLKEEFVVAIAGPLQNLNMIILSLIMLYFQLWDVEWVRYFCKANALIAGFNLLPLLPLDGGKILQVFLAKNFPYKRAILISIYFSYVASFLIFLYSTLIKLDKINLNLLILSLFFLISNWKNLRFVPYQFMQFLLMKQQIRKNEQDIQVYLIESDLTLNKVVNLFYKERLHFFFLVDKHGKISHTISEQKILHNYLDLKNWDVTLRELR